MKNILFIHQSTDLYGSSKTILYLAKGFKEKGINPIVVIPDEGPLTDLLREMDIQVIIAPILKLSRKMFGFHMVYTLPRDLYTAIRKIDTATRHLKIDLVYSNTLAVLIGIIYAKRRNIRHVWHIHEIIERPDIARYIFQRFLSFKTNSRIIYNSEATKKFWERGKMRSSSTSVLNGIPENKDSFTTGDKTTVKTKLMEVAADDLVIALVGRINKWKGQHLLLEALKNVLKQNTHVKLVFVGSPPPGQDFWLEKLKESIHAQNLSDHVKIIPFQHNIWPVWNAIDIAVVPSTLPEPFGMVTVEAMLSAKPVVAANHGGLSEIVVHGETGFLFEPGNAEELRTCLIELINDKTKRETLGKKGRERAVHHFSVERYVNDIEKVCSTL